MKDFIVKEVTRNDCLPYILNVHYARRIPSISYAYGLFYKDNLIGIVTYGKPASPNLCIGLAGKEHRGSVLELNRLVITTPKGVDRKNLASFLVGRSLRKLPTDLYIVSYADCEGWHHTGYVYQATNFMYTGKTKRRTDIWSPSGHARHHCGNTQKRQIRTAKHRYVFITGKRKAELIKYIKYPILPYPKEVSETYDTTNPAPKDTLVGKLLNLNLEDAYNE